MLSHNQMPLLGNNIEALYKLTPTQEGILYHCLLAPGTGVYIQQYACTIDGDLDDVSFRLAWSAVAARHPALRTLIVSEGQKNPLQLVRGRVEVPFSVEDLSGLDPADQTGRISEYLAGDRLEGIQLDIAPLMRVKLFRLGPLRFRMVWTHHHLTIDGWSIAIVLNEVFDSYQRIVSGRETESEPGPRFQTFVNHLTERDRSAARAYWTRYLKGFDEPNQLGGSAGSAASPWADTQQEASYRLTEDLTRELTAFARTNSLTLSSLVRGAWALVLNRYTGEEDLVFGATVAGRPPELDDSFNTVGLFINTVPVRVSTDPKTNVLDWLMRLQEDQLRMAEHDWVPLPEIQEWAETRPGHPLFTSLVVIENLDGPSKSGPFEITDESYEQRSNYPLALLVYPEDQIQLLLLHDPQRFSAEVASRMLSQLSHVLERMITSPIQPLGDISVLPPDELRQIIDEWNPVDRGLQETTILSDIVNAAERNPEKVALTCNEIEITYIELLERAGRICDRLQSLNVEKGSIVVTTLDRTPGAVVAILGIMMAGGIYVPVDPDLPPARMAAIVADTSATVVIGDPTTGKSQPGSDLPWLGVAPDGGVGESHSDGSRDAVELSPEDIAYVIYTSGSTGMPKGVTVSHGNLAYSTRARYQVYTGDPSKFLLLSPFYFDSSVAGIFWTLARAGTLVFPGQGLEQDIQHLGKLIGENEVTHLLTLPAVYGLMLDSVETRLLASLELAIVAGEPCAPLLAEKHHQLLPDTILMNEYGPTEATVWATAYRVMADDAERDLIPVGRSIPGTDVFVLDHSGRPSPVGVVGELYIGGPGVAVGYLNNPELTDTAFRTVSLPVRGPSRLYRTGDLARYDDNGLIELTGRADAQVKIRGRRIEPGEIETVTASHPDVKGAAVRVFENGAGGLELSLFYVPRPNSDVHPQAVRSFLSDHLPTYLVPDAISPIAAIPVTANGKLDRNRLPLATEALTAPEGENLPATEAERLILGLTRDLLGHDRVQITDNFFDAGGHSLLSMHLIARIFSATEVAISPNVILFNSLRYAASLVSQASKTVEETDASRAPEVSAPARNRRSDHAIRFGGQRELFGILHLPTVEETEREPVLICPPYGWEYYKTHWALRNLARQLWEQNHPVLRFDYGGTGDSEGGHDISLVRWMDDIRLAIEELRSRTASKKVNIVGLRIGAALAAMATLDDPEPHNLILWDPVVSGAGHLFALEEMHRTFFARKNPRSALRASGNELLGSPYPPSLRAELEKLDMRAMPWGRHVNTTALVSKEQDEYRELGLASSGAVEIVVVEDAGAWTDLTTFNSALLPTTIPRRITELLGANK